MSQASIITQNVRLALDELTGATSLMNTGSESNISADIVTSTGVIILVIADPAIGQVLYVNTNNDSYLILKDRSTNFSGPTGVSPGAILFGLNKMSLVF